MSKRALAALLGVTIALVFGVVASWSEDFSVHLNDYAQIDANRASPEFRLDELPARDGEAGTADMPRRTKDVYIRFKKFGDVFLDQGYIDGPSTGGSYAKGMTFSGGLADLHDVKMGWIKGSPDLYVVVWVMEHGSGNQPEPDHELAILQLKDGAATVLARQTTPCAVREIDFERGEPMSQPRFSWDEKTQRLVERITSTRIASRAKRGPMLRPAVLDEAGTKGFSVQLDETFTVTYTIEKGKLAARSGMMTLKTGQKDDLAEIAAFYLAGETKKGEPESKQFKDQAAAIKALLAANPWAAAEFQKVTAGEPMVLPKGVEVRIPLEETRIIAEYGGTGIVSPDGKRAAAPSAGK